MTAYERIIQKYLPKDGAQERLTQARLYSELTAEEKAQREADIFNAQTGRLTGYDCDKCKNKGTIYSTVKRDFCGTETFEVVSRPCECLKMRAEFKRIKKSGLARLIERYNFGTYIVKSEWQAYIKKCAEDFATNPVDWFYIGGQSGCGKTHICTAIIGSLLKQGRSARYMLWGDDITAIKQAVTNAEQYEKLMSNVKNADVLYIDDFFKTRSGEGISNADVNTTFKIINHRYNEQLPTVISSELSINEIAAIDEALGSRIAEMTRTHKIYISKDKSKNQRFYYG